MQPGAKRVINGNGNAVRNTWGKTGSSLHVLYFQRRVQILEDTTSTTAIWDGRRLSFNNKHEEEPNLSVHGLSFCEITFSSCKEKHKIAGKIDRSVCARMYATLLGAIPAGVLKQFCQFASTLWMFGTRMSVFKFRKGFTFVFR